MVLRSTCRSIHKRSRGSPYGDHLLPQMTNKIALCFGRDPPTRTKLLLLARLLLWQEGVTEALGNNRLVHSCLLDQRLFTLASLLVFGCYNVRHLSALANFIGLLLRQVGRTCIPITHCYVERAPSSSSHGQDITINVATHEAHSILRIGSPGRPARPNSESALGPVHNRFGGVERRCAPVGFSA